MRGKLNSSSKAPSIEDVAELAGLSLATASRALRNSPNVRPETRERILRAAEALAYRTNPYISVLMAHLRTGKPVPAEASIAYIDMSPSDGGWRDHAVQRAFYQGTVARTEAAALNVQYFWGRDPAMTQRRLTEILEARGLRGVVVPPMPGRRGLTAELPFDVQRFATVSLGARYYAPDLHFTSNDQAASAQRACAELRQLGSKRLGFAGYWFVEEIVDHQFGAGFVTAEALESPRPLVPLFLMQVDGEKSAREQAVRGLHPVVQISRAEGFARWFERYQPEAIVTTAWEIEGWLGELGLKVPDDVGIAHLNLDAGPEGYSGIRQNNEEVAAAAVDMLFGQLCRNECGVPAIARGMLIEGDWVEGRTTRRR